MTQRIKILNIWIDPVTRQEALDRVKLFLRHGTKPHVIFASNPEKNYSVPRSLELYRAYRDADLLLPDGIGVVLAARLLYGIRIARIPGAEFFYDLCMLAEEEGHGIYIYGSRETVNRKAAIALWQKYPKLQIAGRSDGYVKPEGMNALVEDINRSGAKILFLALGSPRQEEWFATYGQRLKHVRVCQAIGGTLDTIAGTVKRAPAWWCRYHLEWLYRLLKEPKRIKRQKVLPLFALQILLASFQNKLRG